MFSKKFAGIGAVVALVGSALVPSVAFAADPTPTPSPSVVPGSVAVTKTVRDNSSIINDTDKFAFSVTPVSSDTGEAGWKDSSAISLRNLSTPLEPGSSGVATANNIMPETSVYGEPGIYEWIIAENAAGSTVGSHTVRFDGVSYRVKAYIVEDPEYPAAGHTRYMYKAVTIVQLTDHNGNDLTPLQKVGAMSFENVYEDVTTFEVNKVVANTDGMPEATDYLFQVTFTWPENFKGQYWPTTNTPAITFGPDSQARDINGTTLKSCAPSPAANPTSTVCNFRLGKNEKATFVNVPVGAGYTVVETVESDDYSKSGDPSGTIVATAANNTATVTNTYEPVTPTGIILAVMPYVLMIGIPLLAIAGYIALRRKMNL